MALGFIVAGGVSYSLGVIFHAWQRLRFQNAIWHCFVLLGAGCHYTAILDLVLQSNPGHAGALHYLIHDYDDPEHASLGLGAARSLAAIAPDSSHARHMPSHIFLQLGMWQDGAR